MLHEPDPAKQRAVMREFEKHTLDDQAHEILSLWWYRVVPHRSYVNDILPLLGNGLVRGMAHITGGGLSDNLPRTLPEDCIARLDPTAWDTPAIFDYLVTTGRMSVAERYRVFNMGVGFVLVVAPESVDAVMAQLPEGRLIGQVIPRVTSDESAVQGLSC